MNDHYLSIIARNTKAQIDENEIKKEHRLYEDLGYDSIGFISMVVAIEDAYNFAFDDEYINPEAFKTVEDVEKYIKSKIDR